MRASRLLTAARFQQRQWGERIQGEVGEGVGHAVFVRNLPCEIEDHVLPRDDVFHQRAVAQITDHDAHGGLDTRDVRAVAAMAGNQGIHNRHGRAPRDEPVNEVATDEA